jgi:hypothetical protein
MSHKNTERSFGIMVGLATAGLTFFELVGCASSPSSPVVADASLDRAADSSVSVDAPSVRDTSEAASLCTGPAAEALIDDMSGSSISLTPPSCGAKGAWAVSNWSADPTFPGSFTVPSGDPTTLLECGSLCQSLYSPLPAGFPGAVGTGDDGGAPGPQAMCVAGLTGTSQYDGAGMFLELAFSGTSVSHPALIDASAYGGIEFWLWVSPSTAASVGPTFLVQLIDKNQIPEGGVCDANDSGVNACAAAMAGLSGSPAAEARRAGTLYTDDSSELRLLAGGWQHVRAPWSSFVASPWWGGANEQTVDPRTLAGMSFFVSQDNVSGPAVPFDFCIYQLSFLPKSDVPVLDGGAQEAG